MQIDLRRGQQIESLVIEFGKLSEYLHPYAAVKLGGTRMVFEFPLNLYRELVSHHLTIPKPTAAPRDGAN